MAMIKCPECGHSTSSRAPKCPECGVEIEGKITTCNSCGETYFNDEPCCPHCKNHSANAQGVVSSQPTMVDRTPNTTSSKSVNPPTPTPELKKKKKNNTLLISFVVALVLCAGIFYFYSNAQKNKEQEAYELAMKSNEAAVLQDYLANFTDAPQEHIDSIQSHLARLSQVDTEWTNVLVSNSREAIQQYLENNPNSIHKAEALRKIDSLDWIAIQERNTMEAYQSYLDDHFDGAYIDQAKEKMKLLKAKEVQEDEAQMVNNTFRTFFQGLNEKNEAKIASVLSSNISSFLGRTDFSESDINLFLRKLYKDDIEHMQWRPNNDIKITKKEIGIEQYEYKTTFMVMRNTQYKDGKLEKTKYKIQAVVDPQGQISEFNMSQLAE